MWTFWSGETQGHCINAFVFRCIFASFNIVLDIIVMLLPIPALLKLNLSKKKKIQVVAMFCVGLL